jgi:catechol 2,3-dioxygenase-like lactoylglutathione lyase family enzyme
MSEDDFPAPAAGFVLTHFLVVADQDRARDFYVSVFGAKVVGPRGRRRQRTDPAGRTRCRRSRPGGRVVRARPARHERAVAALVDTGGAIRAFAESVRGAAV